MSCPLHDVCKLNTSGVAICIVDPRRRTVLMGRERWGKYAGRYNICSGGVDQSKDHGCLMRTAMRELNEEFKLRFEELRDFERFVSVPSTGRLRYMVLGTTPIFIAWIDQTKLSLDRIMYHMRRDLDPKRKTDPCYQEMDDVQWVHIDDLSVRPNLSRLSIAVMKRLRLPTPAQNA